MPQAEADQAENGENSDLHIIIFDEIDAICKKRGSTRDNTGVHDSVVNQVRPTPQRVLNTQHSPPVANPSGAPSC